MHNQFRGAFDSVRATPQMKQRTCAAIRRAAEEPQRRRPAPLRYAALCCALLALVLCGAGGYSLYHTPVSYISVDVNPSVELGLNRFNRVVTVSAYNDDGARILQGLDLKNKPYTEAIELLLADQAFARYLAGDALLSFTVVSEQEAALLTGIQQCHGYAQANAECHGAEAQLMEDAHHSGLSFGKYQAFLALSQYDETLTAEDCQDLSMRQIRDLIRQYESGVQSPTVSGPDSAQGSGHHGDGHGYGYRGGRGEPRHSAEE